MVEVILRTLHCIRVKLLNIFVLSLFGVALFGGSHRRLYTEINNNSKYKYIYTYINRNQCYHSSSEDGLLSYLTTFIKRCRLYFNNVSPISFSPGKFRSVKNIFPTLANVNLPNSDL